VLLSSIRLLSRPTRTSQRRRRASPGALATSRVILTVLLSISTLNLGNTTLDACSSPARQPSSCPPCADNLAARPVGNGHVFEFAAHVLADHCTAVRTAMSGATALRRSPSRGFNRQYVQRTAQLVEDQGSSASPSMSSAMMTSSRLPIWRSFSRLGRVLCRTDALFVDQDVWVGDDSSIVSVSVMK